mgnify:FL=1
MGLKIFHDGDHEMPMVSAIEIPDELDGDAFRSTLLKAYGVEISNSFGSLKGRIWRLGTMGYVAQRSFVQNFIALFGAALLQAGVDVDLKAGLDTFESVYEDDKVLM